VGVEKKRVLVFKFNVLFLLECETESTPPRCDVVTNLMALTCFFLLISFLPQCQLLDFSVPVVSLSLRSFFFLSI
jgi:hypothetical protein